MRNALENIVEALKVHDFRSYKRIFFLFWTYSAGRGYLTLRRFLPHARILQKSIPIRHEGTEKHIQRDNWHTFTFGRERVWGEYLRIKHYGERGDIAFDEVRDLVEQIGREMGHF